MKIVFVAASTRAGSQSRRVTDYLAGRLQQLGAESSIIDLYEQQLPMYADTDDGPWKPLWESIEKELNEAEGYVFVSPEWDGMASAALFNMLHYASNDLMANKPVTLVGVSSGTGGAYPIAQMRQIGPKNKHYIVTSESIIFRDVEKLLVDGKVTVEAVEQRADYALKVLLEYAKALKQVRASGIFDFKAFKNGV